MLVSLNRDTKLCHSVALVSICVGLNSRAQSKRHTDIHNYSGHTPTLLWCEGRDSFTLQHTATHCNTLQHTATHCNTRQHTATQRAVGSCLYALCLNQSKKAYRNTQLPQTNSDTVGVCLYVAVCCSVCCSVCLLFDLVQKGTQHTATHCNTLQHTATHYVYMSFV